MRSKKEIVAFCVMVMAILGSFFMQGCTKEDNTHCGIVVHFKYDKNVYFVDRFSNALSRMELHIFDANNNFLRTETRESEGAFFTSDFEIKMIDLQPGTYTLVAWGNRSSTLSQSTLLREGPTNFDNATLTLNAEGGTSPRTESMTLFHSCIQKLVVQDGVEGTQEVLMDLTKFTNHIVVTAKGLPVTIDDTDPPFHCFITSANGSYKFDGDYANDDVITYNPLFNIPTNNTIVSDFTILREVNANLTDSKMFVTKTVGDDTQILVEIDLVDMLVNIAGDTLNSLNTGELDRDDEFRINLEFDMVGATVTVYINQWKTEVRPVPL